MNTFKVNIVSTEKELYSGDGVVMLSATGSEGEIGILYGHTPFLSELRPGQVRLKFADKADEVIYVSGGFIEVQPDQTIILADDAERAEDLDEEKIKAAEARARELMSDSQHKVDHARAQAELIQAAAQLSAIRRKRGHL